MDIPLDMFTLYIYIYIIRIIYIPGLSSCKVPVLAARAPRYNIYI